MISKIKGFLPDLFVPAIGLTVFVAWLYPSAGGENSRLPLEALGTAGVAMIFFFYGLKLSFRKIREGLSNYNLHLLVQCSSFLIFPLIVLPWYPLAVQQMHELFFLSFLFLAALPSTVSSSVVMVSIAGGNIPAAIFNASISGLIGVFITPLWMAPFLKTQMQTFSFGPIYFKLFTEILLPVVAGLALQKRFGKYVQTQASRLAIFDKAVILLIIYRSFCHSFESKIFSSVGVNELLLIGLLVCIMFSLMYFLTGKLAGLLRFSAEDRITAQYCGTKKSLVHGTVFSKILFPASMPLGYLLLPLMLYHALQIFVISLLAGRERQNK